MIRILIAISVGPLLLAQTAPVTHTERLDFPMGGALRMEHALGEVTIEGWDQPAVEVTTVKSTFDGPAALAKVRIETERKGDEVVISTRRSGHLSNVDVQYRIRIPRSARLIVNHGAGQVNIQDVSGEVRVSSAQGVIMLHLPESGQYSIDALSAVGNVISDFPGEVKQRRLLGHTLMVAAAAGPQKLYLRDRYGDILILRKQQPAK